MQKIYLIMVRSLVVLGLLFFSRNAAGQELRSTPFQYQYSQLLLNPAYASRLPHLGFDAIYLGNFNSNGQVSRTAVVNVQGPTSSGGIGTTLQFFRNAFFGEMTLRPAYAYRLFLPNGGEISFGGNIGLNYFDNDELNVSNLQSDFFSVDGGIGVFYHADRFFVGLSSLKLFEIDMGLSGGNSGSLSRENPYSLYSGYSFRLMEDIELMPRALVQYTNIYGLPDGNAGVLGQDLSFDFQLGAIIQEIYAINLLYGVSDEELTPGQQRFGLSASYFLGKLKLTYAFQANSWRDNSVSLPDTHIISAAYDLGGEEQTAQRRFF